MEKVEDFNKYSIFELLQLLWGYHDHARCYKLWGKEVTFTYFHHINHCQEACLGRWTNNLLDFYFVCDKIEQQCELFLPGSLKNEEIFMESLFGIRRVVENML